MTLLYELGAITEAKQEDLADAAGVTNSSLTVSAGDAVMPSWKDAAAPSTRGDDKSYHSGVA
jgi:hypothetical protein